MSALASPLRRQLERAVLAARRAAENGTRKAVRALGVDQEEPPSHLTPEERDLHRRLRAQAHMLGDDKNLKHLIEKIAYDHWHRLLFSRFLLENNMLLHPEHRVPLDFNDIANLATEANIREPWDLAARYTTLVLRAIFRPDDPVGELSLPSEDRGELLRLLKELPVEVFRADDSLGWVYQFWRADEKDAVNEAGNKIDADTLPAVTQLFTEDYMVLFLLHNTARRLVGGKATVETQRQEIRSGVPGGGGVAGGEVGVPAVHQGRQDSGVAASGGHIRWLAEDGKRVTTARSVYGERAFRGGGTPYPSGDTNGGGRTFHRGGRHGGAARQSVWARTRSALLPNRCVQPRAGGVETDRRLPNSAAAESRVLGSRYPRSQGGVGAAGQR